MGHWILRFALGTLDYELWVPLNVLLLMYSFTLKPNSVIDNEACVLQDINVLKRLKLGLECSVTKRAEHTNKPYDILRPSLNPPSRYREHRYSLRSWFASGYQLHFKAGSSHAWQWNNMCNHGITRKNNNAKDTYNAGNTRDSRTRSFRCCLSAQLSPQMVRTISIVMS